MQHFCQCIMDFSNLLSSCAWSQLEFFPQRLFLLFLEGGICLVMPSNHFTTIIQILCTNVTDFLVFLTVASGAIVSLRTGTIEQT